MLKVYLKQGHSSAIYFKSAFYVKVRSILLNNYLKLFTLNHYIEHDYSVHFGGKRNYTIVIVIL